MKDKNEYGKNIVEKVERLRLGKITLEFGSSGSLTDENMNDFLASIRAVDTLTVRGLITDISENLKYIVEKLKKFDIDCGEIRAEITI